ncbi:MAG: biotin/lipoyl-binding protein, partial [Planctomycetaceae bacterium]|nr:biotin/lipoyl-binding protein [Planctomycetaceae bacterium]
MNQNPTSLGKFWSSIRGWFWRAIKLLLLVAIAGGVFYWVRFSPMRVTPYRLEQGELVVETMGTGTLEAKIQTTISPKISGRIEEVLVDQGDRVQEDQLLVRLDDEELKQQVAIAQANREAAQAAIDRLKTDKMRATAVFDQARKNYDRKKTL